MPASFLSGCHCLAKLWYAFLMSFWLAFYGMPRIQKRPARRTRGTSRKHITIWPNCGTWTRRRKEKRKRPRRNFKATLIQAGGISTYHNSSSSPATYNSFLVTSSSSHPTGEILQFDLRGLFLSSIINYVPHYLHIFLSSVVIVISSESSSG